MTAVPPTRGGRSWRWRLGSEGWRLGHPLPTPYSEKKGHVAASIDGLPGLLLPPLPPSTV